MRQLTFTELAFLNELIVEAGAAVGNLKQAMNEHPRRYRYHPWRRDAEADDRNEAAKQIIAAAGWLLGVRDSGQLTGP
jgi:hypothetical protein